MKCKGCEGEIEYVPTTLVKTRNPERYFHAGPALTHEPFPPCQWFEKAPASEILAYLNVAAYKARATPLPGLATK